MSEDEARQAVALLHKVGWPDTHELEFHKSRTGAILFHPDVALTARVLRHARVCEHPLIAPCVGHFRLSSTVTVEICPGLRLQPVVSRGEEKWIKQQLRADGIDWQDDSAARGTDSRADNLARLPLATPDYPHGLPVVVDRDYLIQRYDRPQRTLESFGVPAHAAARFNEQLESLRVPLRLLTSSNNPIVTERVKSLFWNRAYALTSPTAELDQMADKPFYQGWQDPPLGVYDDPFKNGIAVRQIYRRQQERRLQLSA